MYGLVGLNEVFERVPAQLVHLVFLRLRPRCHLYEHFYYFLYLETGPFDVEVLVVYFFHHAEVELVVFAEVVGKGVVEEVLHFVVDVSLDVLGEGEGVH